MDLGLKGRKAIICAASKGLGRACAEALAALAPMSTEEIDEVARAMDAAALTGTYNTRDHVEWCLRMLPGVVAQEIAPADRRGAWKICIVTSAAPSTAGPQTISVKRESAP